MITAAEKADFLRGYLAAALWASTHVEEHYDEHGELISSSDESMQDDEWEPASRVALEEEATKFLDAYPRLLVRYCRRRLAGGDYNEWEAAGHDFWLDRNGSGTGFWDRDCGPVGAMLSERCGWRTEFGELYLYRNDEGLAACDCVPKAN